ncbi:glycosyltransferase [Microbacterium sp. KSW4-16]|uniref:glycosyltransferase family 2 protein n=1 Tax=Microbacterium aurugineum TaxID=2851642 RepID=UPI0020BFB6FD|nr:glycosyltransferase family 2 protein [Microbacterium aurugineum]MCK8468758.1 glycosyltransferase [Microbacterium aurugineum]
MIVLDADGELAANALEVVSSDEVFGDDENGAARITVWMKNHDDETPVPGGSATANTVGRLLVRMQDMEFRTVNAAMQSLRARAGTVGLGGNGQFTRLSILDRIAEEYGSPWHGSLLEDYELGLHVVATGSRTKNVNDTHVSQEALPSAKRFITQRTRWAQGNIECASYIPKVVKSPHVTAAGALETTYYLLLPYLQTIGMLALGLLMFSAALDGVGHPDVLAAFLRVWWSVLTIYAIFTLLPFVLWGPIYRWRCEPDMYLATSIRYGFCFAFYIYYMYLVLPAAFVRKYKGKTGWVKTRRNAEFTVPGAPVAIEH